MEADPRWYELLDLDAWDGQAWRDPWVIADPAGNGHHALVTARSRSGHGMPEG
jgi:beta-fructofuranosidase